jgi:ribosome-associated protein
MDRIRIQECLRRSVRFAFSRSSGPGGQNVNKVNTKVDAYFDLADLDGLSLTELEQLKLALPTRFRQENMLHLSVSDERSQFVNRERALIRLEVLITTHATLPKHRRATKPTKASRRRLKQTKAAHSQLKRNRSADFSAE